MAANSKIEWTDATWNPVAGCTPVGPGCDNCYAVMLAVLTALEHEARESFLVDGLPIFGPHIDPAALAKACGVTQRRAEVTR